MPKGKAKRTKVPHRIRAVVAGNVQRLMDEQFAASSNRPKDLAVAAGVSLSTVQRVLNGTMDGTGSSIDTLGHIADVFHLQVYQLFIPGLNRTPQRGGKSRPRQRGGEDGRELVTHTFPNA